MTITISEKQMPENNINMCQNGNNKKLKQVNKNLLQYLGKNFYWL